jgi:type IV pilus assembly protein PilV
MTLVETLVTLVSTSVGLLGIAALQLVSLRSNQEAYVRSEASSLAADMLERVRSNRAAFLAGEYDRIEFDAVSSAGAASRRDLETWQHEIDVRLPGGAASAGGAVYRLPDSNVVVVSVRWGASSDVAGEDRTRSLSLSSEI